MVGTWFRMIGVCGVLASGSTWALNCHTALTTSLGLNGSFTAALTDNKLSILQDGFVLDDQVRIPQFRQIEQPMYLGSMGQVQQLSSQTGVIPGDGFQVVVDSKGILRLISGHNVFPFRVPLDEKVSAAVLYRTPLRALQKQYLPDFRTPEGEYAAQLLNERTRALSRTMPLTIYAWIERSLYKIPVTPRTLADERVRQLLDESHLGIRQKATDPTARTAKTISAAPVPLIDFAKNTDDKSYLVATPDPNLILEVGAPELLVRFQNERLAAASDFLQVVSSHRILVGATTGEIFVVNPTTQEVVHSPSFPQVVWLQSVSMHATDKELEIWAVDAIHGKLFQWNSGNKLSAGFVESKKQLPEGVKALSLSAVSQKIPFSFQMGNKNTDGFFTNLVPLETEIVAERILALGSDGQIYAYLGANDIASSSEREWVTHSFQAEP